MSAATATDPPAVTNAARTSTWRGVGCGGRAPRRYPSLMPSALPRRATHRRGAGRPTRHRRVRPARSQGGSGGSASAGRDKPPRARCGRADDATCRPGLLLLAGDRPEGTYRHGLRGQRHELVGNDRLGGRSQIPGRRRAFGARPVDRDPAITLPSMVIRMTVLMRPPSRVACQRLSWPAPASMPTRRASAGRRGACRGRPRRARGRRDPG